MAVTDKILNDRHANDEQFVERFRREAKNAAGLSHPNIVSIFDRGQAESTYYIAMEYLDGRSLKELITARGPAPIHVAVDYARQILAALRVAHRQGVVHRDIKPHNVLVDGEGRIKVTDFGIARAGPSQMTEEGSIIGTAQYLSPEQAQGAPVTPASDLYSVGIVLYELLTGTVPFGGETPVAPPPPVYYDYEEPPERRRPFWPWLLALGLVVLAGFAAWLAYDQIRKQLNASKQITVADYKGKRESVARDQISSAGLNVHITRRASTAEPPTFVFDQQPSSGNKIPKGNTVTIFVSTGVAKVRVPDVRNKDSTDAAATLAGIGLDPDVHQVYSAKDVGTVVAQAPKPGTKVAKGSKVRINVSKGVAPVTVPPVVGIPYAQASSVLQAKGFKVERVDQDSTEPADTVLRQDPRANTTAPKGSTITLTVSKGPQTIAVPEVTSIDVDTARSTLEQSGFKVKVVKQPANDPSLEGIVLDQDPAPNGQAKRGSTVTIYVGDFAGQTTDTTSSP